MKALSYLLFLFLLTVTTVNKGYSQQRVTQKTNLKRDTLHLYFPSKDVLQDSTENANALDSFVNVWYSEMLYAMNEPILINDTSDEEIYRFTWLRTFHHPVIVRIQKQANITLTLKVLNGSGGYEPGKIITDTTFFITQKDWSEITSMLQQLNFWKFPAQIDFMGNDGSEWILEGSTKQNYHFTTRWSPYSDNNYYSKCCLLFLKLSGILISEKKIY